MYNARKGPYLLKIVDKLKKIPCFYYNDNNRDISSFGHTPMMRLTYQNKIFDAVLQNNKDNNNILNIPTAILGDKDKFISRVFFEDALLKVFYKTEKKDILLRTPNPTTIFLYLEQN